MARYLGEKRVSAGVDVPTSGGSTVSTLSDQLAANLSPGLYSGGAISDDADGTVTVALGECAIRATDDDTATLVNAAWAETPITPTDGTNTYIYVTFDGATATITSDATKPTDRNTTVYLGVVNRDGTTLCINQTIRQLAAGGRDYIQDRQNTIESFARESGGTISITGAAGSRQYAVTAGKWWGTTSFTTAAIDLDVTGSFSAWYSDGGAGWTEQATQTQINITNYDDGDGTLGNLTAGKYGVHWIYVTIDGTYHAVYGTGDYTLAESQSANAPSVPGLLSACGRLVGKITVEQSVAVFEATESVFDGPYELASTAQHNSTSGKQGAGADYYHANQAIDTTSSPSWVVVESTQATGTAPLTVASTTVVPNLNVSQLEGNAAAAFATAAQGSTADAALPRAGGQMAGNITMVGAQTVDGRDLSADGSKLDGIEALADVTDTTNVAAAGAVMDADFTAVDDVLVGTGVGTSAPVNLTAHTALAKRAGSTVANPIGVAAATDLLDRAAGDTRFATAAQGTLADNAIPDATFTAANNLLLGTGAATYVERATLASSAGAADSGKLPRLDGTGKLDNSFIPAAGGGTTSIDLPFVLDFYMSRNIRTVMDSPYGGLDVIVAGQALSNGVPINLAMNIGKLVIVVTAGADTAGDIIVTGTSVDRNTRVETGADTDTVTIAGLTTDNSTTDANGVVTPLFSNAYITSKWFTGTPVVSTTDVNVTVTIYHVAFYQINDEPTATVSTIDIDALPTNGSAWMSAHLCKVTVSGDTCTITDIAAIAETAAEITADQKVRLRLGGLGEAVDGATDGIYLQLTPGPLNQTYWEGLTSRIWGSVSQDVSTTLIHNSLTGLDTGDYMHLTAARHTTVAAFVDALDGTDALAGTSIPATWTEVDAGTGTIDWSTEGEVSFAITSGAEKLPTSGTAPAAKYALPIAPDVMVRVHVELDSVAVQKLATVLIQETDDKADAIEMNAFYDGANFVVQGKLSGAPQGTAIIGGAIKEAWLLLVKTGQGVWIGFSTSAKGSTPAYSAFTYADYFATSTDLPPWKQQIAIGTGNFGAFPASTAIFSHLDIRARGFGV